MKRSSKCINISPFRHYWIGLVFVAMLGLAVVAPPAWAGPPAQLTVPTATPTPEVPEPDGSGSDAGDVSDLFEPTSTPEPDSSNSSDDGNRSSNDPDNFVDETALDDLFSNENNELLDENFVDPFADENSFGGGSLGDDPVTNQPVDPLAEAVDSPGGVVDISILNIYSAPDANSNIIDTLFRNAEIQILGQNGSGEWVQICCGQERGSSGWVQAGQVQFNNTLADQTLLPVLDGSTPTTVDESLALGSGTTALELSLSVESTAVFPGDVIDLEFSITNAGESDAFGVSLRNELPENVEFLGAVYGLDGELLETTNSKNDDAPVFRIDWPELASGESLTATVSVQISKDAGFGIVIDNLAGVGATNAQVDTAGVSIGTPPLSPPDFRILR